MFNNDNMAAMFQSMMAANMMMQMNGMGGMGMPGMGSMPSGMGGTMTPGMMPGMLPGLMPGQGATSPPTQFPTQPGLAAHGSPAQVLPTVPYAYENRPVGGSKASSSGMQSIKDPETKRLIEDFKIDLPVALKLNEAIIGRADTKPSDLAKLRDLLEDQENPSLILEQQVREMAAGTFEGKVLEDREVEALALNFNLSGEAKLRLNEVVSKRATKKGQDLVRLESILEHVEKPSQMTLSLVDRLQKGKLDGFPDLREAEDVIKKFRMTAAAKRQLFDLCLERANDSSRILGQLEVYFEEYARNTASTALQELLPRLMSGGDVPEEPLYRGGRSRSRSHNNRHEREHGRHDRGGARRGGRSPAGRDRSRSRPQYRNARRSPSGRRGDRRR